MASVIPSVMLAAAAIMGMLIVLGGIVQFYTLMSTQPAIYPAYGTIVVTMADPTNMVFTITNRYGMTVKALFSIYVTNHPDGPRYVFVWKKLPPGDLYVNLTEEAIMADTRLAGITPAIDLSKSNFIVGDTVFPFSYGAGALTYKSFSSTPVSTTYTRYGVGFLRFSNDAHGIFQYDDVKLTFAGTVEARAGYTRSVSPARTLTKTVLYESGYRCRYYLRTYYGYYNNTTLNACLWTSCTYSYEYRYYYTNTDTQSFVCAEDGVDTMFWTGRARFSYSYVFRTAQLYGVRSWAPVKDSISPSYTPGATASASWPYIKEDQSECEYTYTRVIWSATLTRYTAYACDEDCGSAITLQNCTETNTTTTQNRWGCQTAYQTLDCAGLDQFFEIEITSVSYDVEATLDENSRNVVIDVYATYTLEYRFLKDDPELNDDTLSVRLTDKIQINVPGGSGYVSIPYTAFLNEIRYRFWLTASVVESTVTSGGYSASRVASVSTGRPVAGTATVNPVGLVKFFDDALYSAKTYAYTTGGARLALTLSASSDSIPINTDGGTIVFYIHLRIVINNAVIVAMEGVG